MKTTSLLPFITLFTLNNPPTHTGLCGVIPVKAYSQSVFGTNVGYYISLKNNSSKTVDGVTWIASFYNNFGDYKGKQNGKWESGNFTSPAKPGESMTDLESAWIEGATKVVIKVTRVHFTDESSCGE